MLEGRLRFIDCRFRILFLAPADNCLGGECVPLTVIIALTVTCSPEGGTTLDGLGVVSLHGRSTLVGGRDASLAGMQSFLAVMSSSSLQNLSRCSLLPNTLVCIQLSLPRLPPSVPVVAFFLPWPQSSSGGGQFVYHRKGDVWEGCSAGSPSLY